MLVNQTPTTARPSAAVDLEAVRGGLIARLPFVSVIITAYNQASWIGECLTSVHAQSYTNFECVVVDDDSNDGTADAARATLATLNDARFSVVQTPENVGQLGAEVLGFSKSSGQFVVFLNADDLLHETFLERHLFAHLNCEVVVGLTSSDQWVIDASGSILSYHHSDLLSHLFTDEGQAVTINSHTGRSMQAMLLAWQHTHFAFREWWWGTQSTMMFRRTVLDLILPDKIDSGVFRLFTDFYLARFAQLVGGSLILQEALGSFRRHGANSFSRDGPIATRVQTGDMRVHPRFKDLGELALATLTSKAERFIAGLGLNRYRELMDLISLVAKAEGNVEAYAHRLMVKWKPLWKHAVPLVSIVVTAHNYARFIGECLASIREQTYANFECIVVDDASTDGTPDIAKATIAPWKDSRFSVVSTPENLGQLGAQVSGFAKTRGEFVVFVDADDVLHENFLERHLFVHLNSEVPVAFTSSDQWTIDGSGTVLSFHHSDLLSRYHTAEGREMTIGDGSDLAMRAFLLPWQDTHIAFGPWWWATQTSMMFRRPVLDLVLPNKVEPGVFRICADFYLVRFAQLIGGSLLLRESLCRYRRHGSNNFSSNPLIGARMQTGDMRKHPENAEFFNLALFVLRKNIDRFIAIVGEDRYSGLLGVFAPDDGKHRLVSLLRASPAHRAIRWIIKFTLGADMYSKIRARFLRLSG